LPNSFEEAYPARLAAFLFGAFDAAERDPCSPLRTKSSANASM